ncbi:VOC family protein [Arthrobacter sp. MMS24-S77]
MSVRLNPYLSFKEAAREARVFYHSVFDGVLTVESSSGFQPGGGREEASKVSHAVLVAGCGLVLMASDAPDNTAFRDGTNHSMSLCGDNEDEMCGYWSQLVVNGIVSMSLAEDSDGVCSGICIDQFGITWIVSITTSLATADEHDGGR